MSKQNIVIEKAKPEDAAKITRIQRVVWLNIYPNDKYNISFEDVRQRLKGKNGQQIGIRTEMWKNRIEKTDSNHGIFVAKYSNDIVGFLAVSKEENKNNLQAIHVLPDKQKTGTGGLLIEKAIKWFDNDNNIYVIVVSYNKNAIEFYRHYGFKKSDKYIEDKFAQENGWIEFPKIEMVLIKNDKLY